MASNVSETNVWITLLLFPIQKIVNKKLFKVEQSLFQTLKDFDTTKLHDFPKHSLNYILVRNLKTITKSMCKSVKDNYSLKRIF